MSLAFSDYPLLFDPKATHDVQVVALVALLSTPLLLGAAVTAPWVTRAWRRRSDLPRGSLFAAALLVLAIAGGLLGIWVSSLHDIGIHGGARRDPSQKARLLGEAISTAMNCTALALIVWLPTAIALHWMSRGTLFRAKAPPSPPAQAGGSSSAEC